MDDISLHLREGRYQVIDADISKYFDSISHEKLLELVAQRIVDKNILKLIRMWLKAPVVEEGEDGKKKYTGNDQGTPQGGVISPLLANIYLNVLDQVWQGKKIQERMGARLIRYADDFVVLCQGEAERILRGIQGVLGGLGLQLNGSKTRVLDAREESFHFLGFRVMMVKHPRTGRRFCLIRPAKRALAEIRAELRSLTRRNALGLPEEMVVRQFNERIRGWVGYFYYGNCSRDLKYLRRFVEQRVRIYLRRRHRIQSWGYEAYPNKYLYNTLGLYKIPTTAPWTQTAKAAGRR